MSKTNKPVKTSIKRKSNLEWAKNQHDILNKFFEPINLELSEDGREKMNGRHGALKTKINNQDYIIKEVNISEFVASAILSLLLQGSPRYSLAADHKHLNVPYYESRKISSEDNIAPYVAVRLLIGDLDIHSGNFIADLNGNIKIIDLGDALQLMTTTTTNNPLMTATHIFQAIIEHVDFDFGQCVAEIEKKGNFILKHQEDFRSLFNKAFYDLSKKTSIEDISGFALKFGIKLEKFAQEDQKNINGYQALAHKVFEDFIEHSANFLKIIPYLKIINTLMEGKERPDYIWFMHKMSEDTDYLCKFIKESATSQDLAKLAALAASNTQITDILLSIKDDIVKNSLDCTENLALKEIIKDNLSKINYSDCIISFLRTKELCVNFSNMIKQVKTEEDIKCFDNVLKLPWLNCKKIIRDFSSSIFDEYRPFKELCNKFPNVTNFFYTLDVNDKNIIMAEASNYLYHDIDPSRVSQDKFSLLLGSPAAKTFYRLYSATHDKDYQFIIDSLKDLETEKIKIIFNAYVNKCWEISDLAQFSNEKIEALSHYTVITLCHKIKDYFKIISKEDNPEKILLSCTYEMLQFYIESHMKAKDLEQIIECNNVLAFKLFNEALKKPHKVEDDYKTHKLQEIQGIIGAEPDAIDYQN